MSDDIYNTEADDLENEQVLRPKLFSDFEGQNQVVDNLEIFIEAAKQRGDALDHVLLHGPLDSKDNRKYYANELDVNIKTTSGPILDKLRSAGLLHLEERECYLSMKYIDNPIVEEYLYSAMEDIKLILY